MTSSTTDDGWAVTSELSQYGAAEETRDTGRRVLLLRLGLGRGEKSELPCTSKIGRELRECWGEESKGECCVGMEMGLTSKATWGWEGGKGRKTHASYSIATVPPLHHWGVHRPRTVCYSGHAVRWSGLAGGGPMPAEEKEMNSGDWRPCSVLCSKPATVRATVWEADKGQTHSDAGVVAAFRDGADVNGLNEVGGFYPNENYTREGNKKEKGGIN
ncbi:hypothetical protein F4803DRAFT_85007 [Xylaria telfairii]|nr:hypothetical protein F4803DRAFT_85007 [Xylaria telfairii]